MSSNQNSEIPSSLHDCLARHVVTRSSFIVHRECDFYICFVFACGLINFNFKMMRDLPPVLQWGGEANTWRFKLPLLLRRGELHCATWHRSCCFGVASVTTCQSDKAERRLTRISNLRLQCWCVKKCQNGNDNSYFNRFRCYQRVIYFNTRVLMHTIIYICNV